MSCNAPTLSALPHLPNPSTAAPNPRQRRPVPDRVAAAADDEAAPAWDERRLVRSVDYGKGRHRVSVEVAGVPRSQIPAKYRLRVDGDRWQRDWKVSEVVERVVKLNKWEALDAVLNCWAGRFARRNFYLPIRFGFQPNQHFGRTSLTPCACVHRNPSYPSTREDYTESSQNVDLPTIQPKKKKKPFAVPIKKVLQAGRKDKKMAQMGIEKPLEPPKNGILVPDLIPVAYEVLELWKELIKGVSQLLQVVSVYGCSKCAEVHIGRTGHQIPDCRGTGNVRRRSQHAWVRGTINDILLPIESYHLFDPFGRRIRHETRFNYDRVPALVELCIQAGVDLPEYPSRRRTMPIRMLGKRVIDRGGFVDEPKPYRSDDGTSLLSQIDTYGAVNNQSPLLETDTRRLAERTLKVYNKVRRGVTKLMKKYTVKACGYCSEVHVGPWGHNTKLCGAFKHQWRDGKHGWQDATVDEVFPPNYVWHVRDPKGPPLAGKLKKFYGKAPAVVELCVQAGAEIPDSYRPMMRVDIVVPDTEEARLVA